ncbi:MAG: hypothetical protein QXO32_03290 [Candidatus Bathyarchaeia archaeon]
MKNLAATYMLTVGLLLLFLAVYFREHLVLKELVQGFSPILP